jgi:3-methyladenine DNA glycosylase AlkD
MNSVEIIKKDLVKLSNTKTAAILQRFFKTQKGQYGEGDIFLGIKVPVLRKVAGKYRNISSVEAVTLLKSKVHEERMVALFILLSHYQKADLRNKERIYKIYLKNMRWINNWDLVDLTAPKIVGDYLKDKSKDILHKLAQSLNIWQRRIAILATYAFIKDGQFGVTLKLAKKMLNDSHDLIHKAVGWMLREVGKKNETELVKFLDMHYHKMPRTMLRYSIERLPQNKRKRYLAK